MKYVAVRLIAGIMLKNTRIRESPEIVIKNLGRLTFSENVLKLFA